MLPLRPKSDFAWVLAFIRRLEMINLSVENTLHKIFFTQTSQLGETLPHPFSYLRSRFMDSHIHRIHTLLCHSSLNLPRRPRTGNTACCRAPRRGSSRRRSSSRPGRSRWPGCPSCYLARVAGRPHWAAEVGNLRWV